MINFVLGRFVWALKFIDQGIAACNEGKFRMHAEGLGEQSQSIQNNLKFVEVICREMSLESAIDRLERIDRMFKGAFTYENIETELVFLRQTIEDSIKFERFYHYPKNMAELPLRIDADWAATVVAFPSKEVRFEIHAGVDCYALGHSTAAIFHFMRVAEFGLRALARERRVRLGKNGQKPIEWGTWNEIILKIEAEVKRIALKMKPGPKKDAALDFYSGALAHLSGFKDQYRNSVMHYRREYKAWEAEIAMRQVRDFMNKLSAKISESTKGPLKWS
jgi:hypothetical protein